MWNRIPVIAFLLLFSSVFGYGQNVPSHDTSSLAAEVSRADSAPIHGPHRQPLTSVLPLVVHGWEAQQGQFPFAGYLTISQACSSTFSSGNTANSRSGAIQPGPRYTGYCGSSLIAPRVIVTAGHCFSVCKSVKAPDFLPGEVSNAQNEIQYYSGPATVILNQLNISQPTASVPGAEMQNITGGYRHPNFLMSLDVPEMFDIGIMWFDQGSQVTPVEISINTTTFTLGQQFSVAGWGYTDPNRPSLSDVLRTAVVPYYPGNLCDVKYGTPIWRGNICAGSDPATYADTCAGDSGGPLMINVTESMPPMAPAPSPSSDSNTTTMAKSNQGTPSCQGCSPVKLVGLTSFGQSCANDYPGVYLNVPLQAGWLDDAITLNNAGGLEKPAIQCTSHAGHRYRGIGQSMLHNIQTAGQCCNACKVSTSCNSWSWHSKTFRCLLMGSVVERTLISTWTSGNVTGTIPSGSKSYCELEYYAQYAATPANIPLARYTDTSMEAASAAACCQACQDNAKCKNMSYNTDTKTCLLFKGPNPKYGWSRNAWQYSYISGLVSRK